MLYRKLGRTGMEVSEIGFGAWGIGKTWWGPTEDALSVRALLRALELGVTIFDTAHSYGDGHSEKLIARAFREAKRRVFVATKVPPQTDEWPPAPGTPARKVFPRDWLTRHVEESLRNLETDCLDLLQLHVWRDEWLGQGDWQETVERLRGEGKIRLFGVSIIDHEPETALTLVESGLVDTVQVIYNIFDPSPAETLFPLCQKHQVGVIVRVPFDEGSLTGTLTPKTVFPPEDFRRDYFRGARLTETCARVEKLKTFLRPGIETLPALALAFCLGHPAVSTVIPGMRRPEHVENNCAVSGRASLTADELRALQAHTWCRNFYD